MQTTLYQDWTILSGDTTLRRALKERKTEVVDYQYEQLNTAMLCCKQFRTAIDVGANYGVMSYHMSKDLLTCMHLKLNLTFITA